jgi:hypothetical protein
VCFNALVNLEFRAEFLSHLPTTKRGDGTRKKEDGKGERGGGGVGVETPIFKSKHGS